MSTHFYNVTPVCGPYRARINLTEGAPAHGHRAMAALAVWRAHDKIHQFCGVVLRSYEMFDEDLAVARLILGQLEIPEEEGSLLDACAKYANEGCLVHAL